MSRRIKGNAIVSGSVTETQIDTTLANKITNAYNQANAAYGQANTGSTSGTDAYNQANNARNQANTAYGQANLAYAQANNARSDANTTFATINTTFASINTAAGTQNTTFGTINTNITNVNSNGLNAYAQANAAYGQANAAYGAANTRLLSTGGTLSGDLIITGNLTVSGNQTILNTEVLTTEDAEIVLLSNTSGTPALNAGLIVNRGTSTNTFLRWNEAIDEWGWSDSGTTTYYFEDLRQGLGTINTTFGTTNTTFGTVNTSFGTVNTNITNTNSNAVNAYAQANSARDQANTAYGQANAAYGAANNRVLKAGDTMTGNLTVSGASITISGSSNDQRIIDADTATASGRHVAFPLRYFIGSSAGNYPFAGYNAIPRANGAYSYLTADTSWGINYGSGNRMGFYYAASGTAGANISFSELMSITSTSNVGIGTTNPGTVLSVVGAGGSTKGTNGYLLHIGGSDSNVDPVRYMIGFSHGNITFANNVRAAIGSLITTGGGGNLIFETGTGGAGQTERMRIDSVGNAGIGTTNPGYKLHVVGGITADGGAGEAQVNILNTTNRSYVFNSTNSFGFYDSTNARFYAYYDRASNFWDFQISASSALRINSSSNVGIGTASPGSRLEVYGSATDTEGQIRTTNGSASYTSGINFYTTTTQRGFVGWRGTSSTSPYNASGMYLINFDNSPIIFGTSTGNEKMRIQDNGSVGIGATSAVGKLHVGGPGNTTGGNIHMGDNTNSAAKWTYLTGAHFNGATNTTGISIIGSYSDTNQNAVVIGGSIYEANPATNIQFWTHTATTHNLGGSERMRIDTNGNVGIATVGPFSKLQVGAHTFSGGNGMYADSRVGISNHGSLTGMMLASTYNDATYPEYGLVFVHGPNTSNYNVWSLSPDGPAKGNSLNIIYGSNATNIHTITPKVVLTGAGIVRPGTDNAQDLGTSSFRWANIYTADLNLSNRDSQNDVDGTWGEWTIQEGEEDLFLINRRNGKKFKFMLKEVG